MVRQNDLVEVIRADEEIIRADNLTKNFPNGVTAINGISLTVTRGEIVGVLGASGSGKTTFFRLLNGALMPSGGELAVLGKQMRQISYGQLKKMRSHIAMIYQHHNIIPGLSVAKNVLMGKLGAVSILQALRIAFYVKEKELDKVYGILELLGLTEKIFDRATDLSGGQQQRVAIARALMGEASVILADEPIASVDYLTAETILGLFSRLNQEKDVTVIMNLHQQDAAINYCSRIIVFEKGKVVFDGPPEKFERGE